MFIQDCDIRAYSCIAEQQQGEGCGLEVKRSRKILGHGQVVKVQNWPVKDLDPGRGWIHCVYGSDHPLYSMNSSRRGSLLPSAMVVKWGYCE